MTEHLHVGLDSEGNPVAVYEDSDRAKAAVDADSLLDSRVTDVALDVPLRD